MSINITTEMVEAAAKEAFFVDDLGGHIKGRWTWDTIPEEGRENYRKLSRAVVTAAAPLVLADVAARVENILTAAEFLAEENWGSKENVTVPADAIRAAMKGEEE